MTTVPDQQARQNDDSPFALRIRATSDGLAVAGEMSYTTCAELEQRVRDLDDAGRPEIVLDVSEVTFCDSSGLSTLVGAHRRAQRRGACFRLDGVRGPLARVLSLTGLGALFAPVHFSATADGRGETG